MIAIIQFSTIYQITQAFKPTIGYSTALKKSNAKPHSHPIKFPGKSLQIQHNSHE